MVTGPSDGRRTAPLASPGQPSGLASADTPDRTGCAVPCLARALAYAVARWAGVAVEAAKITAAIARAGPLTGAQRETILAALDAAGPGAGGGRGG